MEPAGTRPKKPWPLHPISLPFSKLALLPDPMAEMDLPGMDEEFPQMIYQKE
jgi:hypothetical protein